MYITGRVEIMSPIRNWHCFSSDYQGSRMISSFNSKRLGQLKVKAWSVVRKWAITLKGEIGMNPLIPASLKGCATIALCN
jgi:hypothetical protein